MSTLQPINPECLEKTKNEPIETVIIPRTADIGGFEVHRALPSRLKRMVGPFIFWDQMGPGEFITGKGLDVRPHPHINLATLTYLFDGEIMHRDSLGTNLEITPGAVNLMTAGSGITHSERTAADKRERLNRLFGIQSWIALPKDKEEMDPAFAHIREKELPFAEEDGFTLRLIAGEYMGLKSPMPTYSDTLYADIHLSAGKTFHIPKVTEERALFAVKGRLSIGNVTYGPHQMLILAPGEDVTFKSEDDLHVLLIGGEVMDGPRHIWWNFVSSSKERIEQAKEDWMRGSFEKVPNDAEEFIPLPKS